MEKWKREEKHQWEWQRESGNKGQLDKNKEKEKVNAVFWHLSPVKVLFQWQKRQKHLVVKWNLTKFLSSALFSTLINWFIKIHPLSAALFCSLTRSMIFPVFSMTNWSQALLQFSSILSETSTNLAGWFHRNYY